MDGRAGSQTNIPSAGGLVDKNTEGKWEREVPLIGAIRLATRRIKLAGYDPEVRLFTGPRGGGITTATLRDATSWDEVVTESGNEHLKRHGLRHTGLTWMANVTCAAYPARAWAARDVRRSDRRARLSRSTSPADGRNHIHDDANAFRRSCPHGTAIHPVRRGSWLKPPSRTRLEPVHHEDWSLAKNTAAAATSSGVP